MDKKDRIMPGAYGTFPDDFVGKTIKVRIPTWTELNKFYNPEEDKNYDIDAPYGYLKAMEDFVSKHKNRIIELKIKDKDYGVVNGFSFSSKYCFDFVFEKVQFI